MAAPVTLLNQVSLSEFTDLVAKDFKMNQTMIPIVAGQLFIEDDLAAHTGNTRRYDEVDTETYADLKREGADAAKARVGVGYNITMTARRFAKEIDITWEMRRHNKAPEVVGQLTALNHYCSQRMEINLTHRITFGNATTYVDRDGETVTITVGDGLALFSAVHTLLNSTMTYSNSVAAAPVFSQGALEGAELLTTTSILSNFGERRVMDFNVIWSGNDPNTVRTIRQVLESTADIDAAHEGVLNVFKGKYRHIVLPNLATTALGANDATKRRWWGIAAVGQGVLGWQAYHGIWERPNLKTPAPGNNGEDMHNDNWTYGSRAEDGVAILSGRGIIASLVAS